MIRGVVTQQREAVIQLSVSGPGRDEVVEAVIDTGFNDFLSLPPALVTALDLEFSASLLATLADGNIVEMNSYKATVRWDDQRREVLVVACDGGPLVGMSLLYGYDLHIEAVDGGMVTIRSRD